MTVDAMPVTVTMWSALTDIVGERLDFSWGELGCWLALANRRPPVRGWSCAAFANDQRAKENVEHVDAVVFDVDEGDVPLDRLREVLAGLRIPAIFHSTKSYTPAAPRWRVVVAVSRPMTNEEHALVWRAISADLEAAGVPVDPAPKDGSRFWYVPCDPAEGEYVIDVVDGAPIDVDALLVVRETAQVCLPPRPATKGYGKSALADACHRIRSASNGSRNATLNDQAHSIAQLVAGGELEAHHARTELAASARAAGLTDCETAKTIASAFAAGEKKPRTRPEPDTSAPASSTVVATPAARPAWESRVVVPSSDWYTKAPPARTWLLRDRRTPARDGVLPLGKVGQLVAEGGGGKTMALFQLMVAVATGTPWLGALDVASPGNVFGIFGEEDQEEDQRRVFNAARASNAPTPSPGSIVTLPLAGVPSEMVRRDENGNPTDAPFIVWLREYLARGTWRLVIVDPLSRFAGLDAEKDNAQATRFIEALESIATQTGATVLVAHHSNQSSRAAGSRMTATSARGVTALVDGVRWAAALGVERIEGLEDDARERLGEVVALSFVKSNYSKKAAPIMLRRDLEHGGALLPLDDADSAFIASAQAASSPTAQKRAERDADREARDAQREAKRTAKNASRSAAKTDRHVVEDETLIAILRATPGINARELRTQMAARLNGCRAEAVDVAVARAGNRVRRETVGTRVRHFLASEDLPWSA